MEAGREASLRLAAGALPLYLARDLHLASRLLFSAATLLSCVPHHPSSETIIDFNSQVSFSSGTRLFS